MKRNILLVNCYREQAGEKIKGYLDWLAAAASAAGMELGIAAAADRDGMEPGREADAVVVSGSQKMVGDGEAEPGLLGFLAGCRRPLLGVCYGHQALAAAFGCRVQRDARPHLGDEEVLVKRAAGLFSGFPPAFTMRESHEEIVARDAALEKNFRVLASGGGGLVEAIAHREYPLFGVQFHPEKSGELGVRLLVNFLNMIPGAR
jgi:anthranilate/para-aminobenzoate synthase component II